MKIEQDKVLHFVTGFFISVFLGWLCIGVFEAIGMNPVHAACFGSYAGLMFSGLAGWAKELMDSKDPRHHTYDGWDALATGGGGWFGACVLLGATLFRAPL